MRDLGIRSIIRSKRKYFGNAVKLRKPNIIDQNFKAAASNIKWTTDVTYLYYNNMRFYLSVILDLYNREVISYAISNRNDIKLVEKTIIKAVLNAKDISGVILHSDQGSLYTTEFYSRLLKSYNIIQSMSRKGNCLDNSPVECFFSHLKSELIYTTRFNTPEDMHQGVDQYINFYNKERLQKNLNYQSPKTYKLNTSIPQVSH